jgi:hypothetical protein
MTKKLDKEHLEAIQELQEKFANNARYLGSIAIELKMVEQQQRILEENEQSLFADFETLREEETKLIEALKERYGDGQINIADGTFTSAE